MQFAHPLWILVGIICCLGLAYILYRLQILRQSVLEKFASAQLIGQLTRRVSSRRRRLKNIFCILAVFFLFLTLARPQYGFKWVEVKRKGIDILFALDTSKSMLAEDIKPNRLQRARFAIMDFVNQLEGDRIGLLPFAGSAFLMCPLTLDYNAFEDSLTAVNSDIIPRGGTDISAVVREAEKVLQNDANHKILILLTDGENLQGDALAAAGRAKELGMKIYTVGVGTPEGELIPLPDKKQSGFVKDEQGQYVTSKLDETTLTAIAEKSDGLYAPLGSNGQGLETIYQEKLALIPKEELAERRHKVPLERFTWPLTVAIVLLLLEFLLPERKSSHTISFPLIRTAGRRARKNATVVILLLASTLSISPRVQASEAEEAYLQEKYIQASELYSKALEKKPEDPVLNYNYGTTAYKNNMLDEAIASFTKALKSHDLSLQSKAYYNRGNAFYQKGSESRQANPQATIDQWEQAVKSYASALELTPDNPHARENQAYVQQQLEELKQQQQQKQEQEQEKNQTGKENQQNNDRQSPEKPQEPGDQDQQAQDNADSQQQPDTENSATNRNRNSDETKEQDAADPDNPEPQTEPSPGNKVDDTAPSQEDMTRRQQGKMTREEAENLLNALKNEEGELNFVPVGNSQENAVGRDW